MKRHKTAFERSTMRLEAEGKKYSQMIYGAVAILLWRHYNKKETAILRFFDESWDVWKTCATDHDHSMIEMCENETGIEIQNGDGKSWHDLMYLNGVLPESMTYEQWVYMRQNQIRWVRPNIMACIMITLHRKYGFGFERCGRFYQQIQDIEAEFRNDQKKIRAACREITGIDVYEVLNKRRRNDSA